VVQTLSADRAVHIFFVFAANTLEQLGVREQLSRQIWIVDRELHIEAPEATQRQGFCDVQSAWSMARLR